MATTATGGAGAVIKKCQLCDEIITDPALHFRKCTGADTSAGNITGDPSTKPSKTAKVCFTWTSISGYPYQEVTLLSAFQSIELYIAQQSTTCQYVSDEVIVPVGEYDGQLVIGSNFCYPVKKFVIEEDGDLVPLEMDITKMDNVFDDDTTTSTTPAISTSSGTYNEYVGAYSNTLDPPVHMNPAYKDNNDDYLYSGATDEDRSTERLFTPSSGQDTAATIQPNDVKYTQTSGDHINYDSQSPPLSSDHLEEKFSQQLSREGFTPATVKSKKGSTTSSTITSNSMIRRSPDHHSTISATSTLSHSISDRSSNNTSKKTTTTASTEKTKLNSSKPEERFLVSQIKNVSSNDTPHQVSMEEHASVCEERDRLKRNYERVTAQLEGRLRALQKKLSKYEGSSEDNTELFDTEDNDLEDTRVENDEIRSELESKERELAEAMDRITALENQMQEYAVTVDDQNRIIHDYTRGGVEDQRYKNLHEMFGSMSEFTKKQQCEFAMVVNSTKKEIERFTHLENDNAVLKEACDKLSTEVTQRRTQAKQFMKDIEDHKAENQALKNKLHKLTHRRTSEKESLELETLRQKCTGWKESAERAMEDMEMMRSNVQQLEQGMESLKQELRDRVQAEKEAGTSKVLELQKKVKEFQDIRISMEEEMSKLRSEKTDLVSRNAELVSLCDPNETKKMRQELEEEKELFAQELKDTQVLLEMHQKKNLDLKEQLEKASNSAKLDAIQEKIGKYKKERDIYRAKVLSLEEQHCIELERLQVEVDTLKLKKRKYRGTCKTLEENYEKLANLLKDKDAEIAILRGSGESSQGLADDIDGGSSHVDSSSHLDIPSVSRIDNHGSTQSPPIDIVDLPKRKPRSGIVLLSSVKANPTHGTSPVVSSTLETTPTTNEYIPSLTSNEEVKVIQIRTKNGLQEAYVQRLDQDALNKGISVVVQRSAGHYEEGVVKYYGYPSSTDLVIGIELELRRSDSSKHPHDGTYKDNIQYFKCKQGHSVYVPLSKVFLKIDIY